MHFLANELVANDSNNALVKPPSLLFVFSNPDYNLNFVFC